MPITWAPDPTGRNPAGMWVDSATGQPANQPGPGYTVGAEGPQAVQVPAAANIDPNASQPPAPTTSIGAPQGQGPNLAGTAGQYTVQQILAPFDNEFANANQAVIDLNTTINGRHGAKDAQGNPLPEIQGDAEALAAAQANAVPGVVDPALQAAQSKYQADLSAWSAAQQRLAAANVARQNALQTAIDKNELVPGQAELAKAQANESGARAAQIAQATKTAADLAPSQQALLVSQGAQAAAQAALDQANAAKVAATTPADIAKATADAALAQAQANAVTAMVGVNQAKVQADTTLTEHQVGLTDAQSDLYQANAREADARAGLQSAQTAQLVPAQAAQAAGAGAASQATAQATLAGIQQKQLGPLYGLQDQVNAIRAIQQQVFGPGGSGDPNEADDLLKQYTTATIAGTTPYAANVAAANYAQNIYGTQASMYNAATQALASRANALSALGGNVLSTLGSMNANAPAGSTALAGAFQDVMNYTAQAQQQAQDAFAKSMGLTPGQGALQQPAAPDLPALLQRLVQGTAQGAQAAAAQGFPSQTGGPVTINIGGGQSQAPAMPAPAPMPQPATFNPTLAPQNAVPGQNYGASTAYTGGVAPWNAQPTMPTGTTMNVGAMPGAGPQGQQSSQLPSMLQGYQPASTSSLMSLWGNELGSGAVQMPQMAAGPSVPSVY
jgi:hypothetical protein